MWSPVGHRKKFRYYAVGMENHHMSLSRGTKLSN